MTTPADHARMSWHQRERLNRRLQAETKALEADVAWLRSLRAKERVPARLAESTPDDARRVLASLPVDPLAAQHRLDLDRELRDRP
jgi:hypothetical protein